MTDQRADDRREALLEAARIADARQVELEAQISKYPHNSIASQACAQGAYEAMWLANAIRRAAATPSDPTGDRVASKQLDRLFVGDGEYVRADEATRQVIALQARANAAEAEITALRAEVKRLRAQIPLSTSALRRAAFLAEQSPP